MYVSVVIIVRESFAYKGRSKMTVSVNTKVVEKKEKREKEMHGRVFKSARELVAPVGAEKWYTEFPLLGKATFWCVYGVYFFNISPFFLIQASLSSRLSGHEDFPSMRTSFYPSTDLWTTTFDILSLNDSYASPS